MKKLTQLIAGIILAVMSATTLASTAADNKVVANVLKEKLSNSEVETILQTPYDGFVEIRGKAKKEAFEFSKVRSKSSFPDQRWEETAKLIADQINLSVGDGTTGSRSKPSATAYVLFYKDGIEGVNTAGARQVSVSDADGDYMALVVVRQKAPRGNVSVQNSKASFAQPPSNKVYKFELGNS
jgi:hypothetical protein